MSHTAPERLADAILKGAATAGDIRTVVLWAIAIGSNKTSLSELCRQNGIRSRDARDFMRVLRTLRVTAGHVEYFNLCFDVGDLRTLQKIRQRAGLVHAEGRLSVDEFLLRQDFIAPVHPVVRAIARQAAPQAERAAPLG